MKTPALLLALLMAIPAFAGRIITYTATSNMSQEDANNAAMAGVAKQIVAEVNVNQTVSKKETTKQGKNTLDESFFSSNNVKSNLKLKGIKIVAEHTDKGFKATASLDLDEFTADIQFQMKRIKESILKLEASAREALISRKYAKTATDLQQAQSKIPEYERLLWQLSKVYPLNESHQLLHNLPEIQNQLLEKLAHIKLEGPTEKFELTKSEMPEWSVLVVDDQGPLPGFPLIAKQARETLSEKRSDDNGKVAFLLRKVNFEKGPYSITVIPSLPLEYLKASELTQGIEVSYDVIQTRCEIQLECKQIANFCRAMENALNQKSIFSTTDPKATKISIDYTAIEKNVLTVGSSTMKSFDVTFNVKGPKVNFQASSKGVGKDELDATIKAIQKADFSKLQPQLKQYCK